MFIDTKFDYRTFRTALTIWFIINYSLAIFWTIRYLKAAWSKQEYTAFLENLRTHLDAIFAGWVVTILIISFDQYLRDRLLNNIYKFAFFPILAFWLFEWLNAPNGIRAYSHILLLLVLSVHWMVFAILAHLAYNAGPLHGVYHGNVGGMTLLNDVQKSFNIMIKFLPFSID